MVNLRKPDDSDDYDLAPAAPPPIPQRRQTTVAPQGRPAPHATAPAATATDHYVTADVIVVLDGATLPPRCVRCNAAADGKAIRKRFAFNLNDDGPSAAQHIPVIGPLFQAIWVIQRIATRQYVRVTYSLCPRHRTMRTLGLLAGWLLAPAGLAVFILGIARGQQATLWGGLAMLFVAMIAAAVGTKSLKLSAAGVGIAELSGASPAFLQSLPRGAPGRRGRY